MDYIYLPNDFATTLTDDFVASDIYHHLNHGILHYICYHITTNSKYPFVQILLDKTHIGIEEFILPSITIKKDTVNINELIIKNINSKLKEIRCDPVIEDAYIGIIRDSSNKNIYALINVSSSNINCLNLTRSTTTWFALPTEIINIESICNIPISENVRNLFTYIMPELGVLYKADFKGAYLLPDPIYTKSSYKNAEFQSLFGPFKKHIYYHFYTLCSNLFQDTNDAITRYALFLEEPAFSKNYITDAQIYRQFDEAKCIIIQDNNSILVKEYELFQPLSFHSLDKDHLFIS